MVRLSAIQLCSSPLVDENLNKIEHFIKQLVIADDEQSSSHFIVLPECCLCFGGPEIEQLNLAKTNVDSHHLTLSLAGLAKRYGVTLIAGTIPLLAAGGNKFTNSSCVFSPTGELISRYDKIHLFDVQVTNSEQPYYESRYTQAGHSVCLAQSAELTLGLSVCYDVRFAELYRQLRYLGADVITVPSAFTRVTGQAHWQALLQARAIENQVYIIAAGQEGVHVNGRETWGHSMIISPWGEILACREVGEGVISAQYHQQEIKRVRQAMPVLDHNKFTVELKAYE